MTFPPYPFVPNQAFWTKSLSKISLKPFPKACDVCSDLKEEVLHNDSWETRMDYRSDRDDVHSAGFVLRFLCSR
jgi:hypothetical protein